MSSALAILLEKDDKDLCMTCMPTTVLATLSRNCCKKNKKNTLNLVLYATH